MQRDKLMWRADRTASQVMTAQTAGILRLLFAHHVDHLNAAQDHTGTGNSLKPEHRPHSPPDGKMVLLNAIIIGHE
jgi:hypothetical protein